MKRYFSILACILIAASLNGQTTKQDVLDNPILTRGHYSTYPAPTQALTPAPEGYAPVYISHYGRHGSRYHTSRSNHTNAYKTLKAAKEAELLTDLGKSVYKRVRSMRTDAGGMDGSLTVVGTQEHRAIAERMFNAYPEVFAGAAVIDCRSTEAPRCILSMAANNERLKELNPSLRMLRSATEGDEEILRCEKYRDKHSKEMGSVRKELLAELDASAFISRIFKAGIADVLDNKDQVKFMRQMFALYQIAGCTAHTGVNFDDVFTPQELFVLWRANNASNYAHNANSVKFGKGVLSDAKPLLQDILENADDALAGSGVSAHLRFGHDVALAPLAALLDVAGAGTKADPSDDVYKVWADFKVMPMAANIQFVFYRNAEGNVLVKVLHNEREVTLPGLKTKNSPYYEWKDVRQYIVSRLK